MDEDYILAHRLYLAFVKRILSNIEPYKASPILWHVKISNDLVKQWSELKSWEDMTDEEKETAKAQLLNLANSY